MIKSFLDLEVYKESFQLQLEIDEVLKSFPVIERFLLIDQMRRASRSIPSQIAEGYAKRKSIKEFAKYLNACVGESNEMMNHLMLSKHKGFIRKPGYVDELIQRYDRLGKKLTNLKNNWQNFK